MREASWVSTVVWRPDTREVIWDRESARLMGPATAARVHANWPGSRLEIVGDAGHAASEPGIAAALVRATEQFRLYGRFA